MLEGSVHRHIELLLNLSENELSICVLELKRGNTNTALLPLMRGEAPLALYTDAAFMVIETQSGDRSPNYRPINGTDTSTAPQSEWMKSCVTNFRRNGLHVNHGSGSCAPCGWLH